MTILENAEAGDGLRERKKAQTRRAIHEAAYRLVDEQGFESTTIDQICHQADVSSRTFFNYYPSKNAAALGLSGESLDDGAATRFRSASGSLVDALCDMIAGGDQFAARHLRLKRLVKRNPELMPTLGSLMTAARGRLIDLAAERAASRDEAELAVSLVLAALALTVHSTTESDLPSAVRLRSSVDAIVAVRNAPLRSAELVETVA
ncbi:TetR/AcrR family transcriptional regulator [Naasia lichenicola]|uniref:TetR family transcriptional regulator n=1 Tax=Naasia lichenicola TaxID=2565933 RepID=A0A4S4FLE4_9MICO|nr:TetR/AcrR family transcriptional regulator [Naasia lichenicola]THG31001.1 TetR family transcriptional regulator [Naasia lichenicola]